MQQPYVQTVQPQQYQTGIKKVNGPQSALQFPVAPNTQSDALFDMAGGVFYIVTADAAGSKTLESFDYSPHVEKPITVDGAEFVSRTEYDKFVAKVSAALEALDGIHGPVRSRSTGLAATGPEGKDVGDATDDAGRHNPVGQAGAGFGRNMPDA